MRRQRRCLVIFHMLALGLCAFGMVAAPSPSTILEQWRATRLTKWSCHLDQRFNREMVRKGKVDAASRYHTQILVVDDCALRARVVEAILDRVAECVDAPIDAMSATVGEAASASIPEQAYLSEGGSVLGLSPYPLEAATQALQPSMLLSNTRFDLVLCTDPTVMERVRSIARAANAIERAGGALPSAVVDAEAEKTLSMWSKHPSGEGADKFVLCCTDFNSNAARQATASTSVELPSELLRLVASEQFDQLENSLKLSGGNAGAAATAVLSAKAQLIDLPRISHEPEQEPAFEQRFESLCVAATSCCSALVGYLAAVSREHATRYFEKDLRAAFASADLVPPTYEEALEVLEKQHAVPGGLSDEQRRRLFDEHVQTLSSTPSSPSSTPTRSNPMRVDVSDLGLSMDDLTGPFL